MQKIGVFDPNQNKYISEYQCLTCDKSSSIVENVWLCRTCKKDICESCKDSEHWNCDHTKDTNDIVSSHPNDCDCNLCDDPYGFFYGMPVSFDSVGYYVKRG